MRCSLLAAAAAVVLAFATPLAEASICSDYATALGVGQKALMDTLITRIVTGVSDAFQTLGNAGTFVALRKTTDPPLDVLDVVSTANFGAISNTITLVGSTGDQIVGVARRPNNGLFYFIDQAAQMYTGDVDGAIRNFNSTLNLTPLGTPVTARTTGSVSRGIGFAFNPVGDAIRITNGNTNFRVNPNTGAAAAPDGPSADGTDAGGSFSYQDPIEGSSPSVVATAYTNQIGTSPRDPATTFGTTQYGIDQANNLFVRFNNSNAGLIGANFPITLESGATADFTVNTGLTVVSQPNGAGNIIVASIVRTINGVKSSGLYTINPNTGAATPLAGALNTNTYRAIAFTSVTGTNGVIVPKNSVTGIFNTASIVGYFNRGILFEDPATQPDYTTSTADLISLRDKLVSFFGVPLGCDSAQVPRPAENAPSQYVVHRNMNITKAEFDAFNLQVTDAASSFGVSVAEVSAIEGVLQTFNRQPFGDNSKAICTQPGCDCAPGYDPNNNCQTILSTSSSSSGSGSGSTGSSSGNGGGSSTAPDNNTDAAAGLSAPFALVAALAVAVAALRA